MFSVLVFIFAVGLLCLIVLVFIVIGVDPIGLISQLSPVKFASSKILRFSALKLSKYTYGSVCGIVVIGFRLRGRRK